MRRIAIFVAVGEASAATRSNANAPELANARRPVEDFAEDRCEGEWRNPAAVG